MTNEENKRRVRFLDGRRLFITPQTLDDFEDHYRWDHDREIVFLDDTYFRAKTREQAREKFESRLKAADGMPLAIIRKKDGVHIGLIELYQIDDYERKCYWGIVLDRKYQRKGYGSEAAEMLLKYVFEDLGFRRLKSYTHSGNDGSMRFQEKLGFVKEGVLREEYFFNGSYYDGIDYAMLREDYDKRSG